MHFLLHRVADSVLTLERLANHLSFCVVIHNEMLSDRLDVLVEALEVRYSRCRVRSSDWSLTQVEVAGGRINFVAKFALNGYIVYWDLLV